MALKRVGVALEAQQTTVFFQAMEDANKAVSGFGTAAIRASGGVDKLDTSTRQFRIDDLERKLAGQAGALNILERELAQTATKYGESSLQADKKRLAIANLTRSISSNEQALESQKSALNSAIQAEIRAEQAVQKLGTETDQSTTKISKLGTETTQATTKISNLGTETLQSAGQAERGFKDIGRAADDARSQIGIFEQVVIGGLRRVGAAAVDLSVQGGRALIGLVGDTLSAAGDFEATLNNFASKTGSAMEDAGFDLQDFSAEFLRLGAETKFSAAEAGQAAVELAKGGVNVSTIMGEATAATLSLASAADLELAPAATIVAKQLGVWGDQGVTATNVVDSLAQAANASTVDVDELALGLANAGGTAKVAGVSFQDTVQAMALLAPGFSSAADAGTSFKTFLSRLIPTTKNATGMMIDLGLYSEETGSKFYDATGSFIGMEQATELLHKATKNLTEEQKIQALQTIFGQDAIRAAAILAENGADGFNRMGSAMANAGSAAEQAAKMNVGYNFAMESLKGSIETVQIILGTKLLPSFTVFAELLADGVNVISAFAQGGDDIAAAMATFQKSLTEISPTLGKYFNVMTDGRGLLDSFAFIIGDLIARFGPLGTAAQGLINIFLRGQDSFAQWTFLGRSLDAVFGEELGGTLAQFFQLISDGINTITAFISTVAGSNNPIATFVQGLGEMGTALVSWIIDNIPAILDGLGQLRMALIQWVIDSLPEWTTHLQALGAAAAQWISDSLPGWQAAAAEYLDGLIAWVQASLPGWIENLKALGAAAAQWIADSAPGWAAKAAELFNAMVAWVTASMPGWIEELKKFANAAIQWVLDALPGLGTNLGTVAGAILAWVVKTTGELIPVLAGLAWEFVKWIATDVIPKLPGALLTIATELGNFIVATVTAVVPELVKLAGKFYAWIEETAIPELGKALPKIWTAITDWITQTAKDIYTAVITIGTNIITGITKGVTDAALGLLNAVVGAVEDTFTAVGDFLLMRSPSKLFRDEIGVNIMAGIAEGVEAKSGVVTDSLLNAMADTLDNVMTGKIADMISKVAGAISAGVDALAKLKTFEAPAREALLSFSYAMRDAVIDFAARGAEIKYALNTTTEAFIKTAQSAVSIIGAGVEGFAKLANYVSPTRNALEQFSKDLRDTVADFWLRAQEIGYTLDGSGNLFAESAGKAVAVIGAAVEAFGKLKGYSGVMPATLKAIAHDIQTATVLMVDMATTLNTKGVESAAVFSKNILSIFGALKTGVATLDAMRGFKAVASEAIGALFHDIRQAIDFMVGLDGVAAAAEFSTKVVAIFNAFKAGMDILNGLRNYKSLPTTQIEIIGEDFKAVAKVLEASLYETGRGMMVGLAGGISSSAYLAEHALTQAMNNASQAAASQAEAGGIAAGSTFAENLANASKAKLDTSVAGTMRAAIAALNATAIGEAAIGGAITGQSFTDQFNKAISSVSPGATLISMQAGVDKALKELKPLAIVESGLSGAITGRSFADNFQSAVGGAFSTNIQSALSNALSMFTSGAAGQSAQGGWLAGSAFANAYQSALGGLAGGGSLIDMPSLSGGFSAGNTTNTTTNAPSYSVNYNGVTQPPPPAQSFAAMAAWAG